MTPVPVRIQRRRTKGFNLQAASPNGLPVVYVGRGTKWGNPYKGEEGAATMTRQMLVYDYRAWLAGKPRHLLGIERKERPSASDIRMALRGKNLACWCPLSQPCHADVLLELANAEVGA